LYQAIISIVTWIAFWICQLCVTWSKRLMRIAVISPLTQSSSSSCLGTLVTDTTSTKQQVVQWARDVLPAHVIFVGGHPMAGRECSGIEVAESGLFAGCTYCLTPTTETPRDAVARLSDLITGLAAHPLIVDAQEHDRLVAGISHLPFVVSAALVRMLGQDEDWARMSVLAAGGYRDMSRLTAGSPIMHRDICWTNGEAVGEWLDRLTSHLAELRSLMVTGEETLERYFAQAKQIRDDVYGASGSRIYKLAPGLSVAVSRFRAVREAGSSKDALVQTAPGFDITGEKLSIPSKQTQIERLSYEACFLKRKTL
jgi:prephenate dehydrogenase